MAILALPWLVVPLLGREPLFYGVMAGLAGGVVILAWWLFFSRAPWPERLAPLLLMPLAVLATMRLVHPSIANAGQSRLLPVLSIPVLGAALVAWAAATRRLSPWARRASLAAAVVVACSLFTVVRTGGVSGEGAMDLHWRWTPTPEEKLLAAEPVAVVPAPRAADAPPPVAPPAAAAAPVPAPATPAPADRAPAAEEKVVRTAEGAAARSDAEWPGFRGPARDGVVRGLRIETDWAKSPPALLWRRKIGPGWSSFAVDGTLVFTQEQRGQDEIVSAYDLASGRPVWRHRDLARFWEANAGPGPRATPTLHGGRVYTFGATGILNALDARDGSVVWSRNAAADTGRKVPIWGFASSPLVVGDAVVVATAGTLAAYDAATGQPRWYGPNRGGGYSSPHLSTIGGV
ncbi:MAG TPA: PQQ-binding-like beta-propeller repeat protein, partial [Vicinamibacteria bacterium]|nr:PQQ-binding-like beta-propeller repeat protein [Vicinamibacteria bacterium]